MLRPCFAYSRYSARALACLPGSALLYTYRSTFVSKNALAALIQLLAPDRAWIHGGIGTTCGEVQKSLRCGSGPRLGAHLLLEEFPDHCVHRRIMLGCIDL